MMSHWLDFNDAPVPEEPESQYDASQLRSRLLQRLPEYLHTLLPNGQMVGQEFVVGSVSGERGKSLKVTLVGESAGLWKDFATDESGDVFSLTEQVQCVTFQEALAHAAHWLGEMPTLPSQPLKRKAPVDELGPETASWHYHSADGQLIATVTRYDPPTGKEFRPWDVKARKYRAPTPRPLYNQPGLQKSEDVLLVEGEKCAQALIDKGFCATTAMNGAKAPVEKTDWSPLKGKRVLIWPDHDQPGRDYARAAAEQLKVVGVSAVAIVQVPESRPAKWDAADALDAEEDVHRFLRKAPKTVIKPTGLVLTDWSADKYIGKAPEQQFLIEGSFPLGVVSILAAMGDTGKGMLTLKLALEVACGSPDSPVDVFGGEVLEHGTAVILSAEDDYAELHRRLERLDPDNRRNQAGGRLIVVPLPDAGGPVAIVTETHDTPVLTPAYERLRQQLMALPDLKLVVFDPLSSFAHADVNAKTAAGSLLTGALAGLASGSGVSVIIAHHMRKPQGATPIETSDQARDAIRGTTALVDGVRMAYALRPASEEKANMVLTCINRPYEARAVYQGAVVKANGPANRKVRTFYRAETGLLEDITQRLARMKEPEYKLLGTLTTAIREAAERGHPFTHAGENGVYKQRNRLPKAFHQFSKKRLEEWVQTLLNEHPPRLVKGMAAHSKEHKWLDVRSGAFAQGKGVFGQGADLL